MKVIAESHPSRVLSSYRVFFFCLAGLFIRAKVVKCPQSALRAFWRFRAKIMLMDDSALCMRVALFVSLKSQGSVINEELASDATKRSITAQEQGEKKTQQQTFKKPFAKTLICRVMSPINSLPRFSDTILFCSVSFEPSASVCCCVYAVTLARCESKLPNNNNNSVYSVVISATAN